MKSIFYIILISVVLLGCDSNDITKYHYIEIEDFLNNVDRGEIDLSQNQFCLSEFLYVDTIFAQMINNLNVNECNVLDLSNYVNPNTIKYDVVLKSNFDNILLLHEKEDENLSDFILNTFGISFDNQIDRIFTFDNKSLVFFSKNGSYYHLVFDLRESNILVITVASVSIS